MYTEKIRNIVIAVNPAIEKYKGNNYIEDGILESIEIMEIVDMLEEEFQIVIDPEYIVPEYFESIAALNDMIMKIKG